MSRITFVRLSIISVLFSTFILFFLEVDKVGGQVQPTSTPNIPTATQLPTFPPQQQVDDLLKTYTEVLEVSKSAVEEVHTTTDKILNWVGILFTALTISGLGGAALLSFYGKNASDKANAAQQKATEAYEVIQKTEMKTTELEKRNDAALEAANELANKQNHLLSQIETAEKHLQLLQTEMAQLKRSGESDRQVIRKPLELVQIDEYGMQALSGNQQEKEGSILALLEMSKRADAVIRRRTVKALGMLDEYDIRVENRLREMKKADLAQGVRKEAEKSLKLIEAKKPKKTTRQKS